MEGSRMKNQNIKIALIALAIFANLQAKEDHGVYQPKSPWPLVVVEDAVVGTAGVLTLGQTEANPSALPMTVPDAIPGVSYARTKDSCEKEKCTTNKKKRTQKETSSNESSKSRKKSKKETTKTTRKKTTTKTPDHDNVGKVVTAPVTVPTAVAADIVTFDTQHFTRETVDSINGDSEKENRAE